MTNVGFIGLGIMGRPMALNLARAGHKLFVHSRSGVPPEMAGAGAVPCTSAGVGISENGKIILATHKAKSWLELDLTGGQIVLKDTDRPGIELTGFQSVKSPGRYMLHVATWTGGTRFYLDSRGMLHLKSHDPSVPEVSIVLQEGLVAAWSSDGLLCGTAFYTDRNDTETDRNKWEAMWNRIMDITRGAT